MERRLRNKIFEGKKCIITGATGGLGKQIAIELAQAGCNLFLTGSSVFTTSGHGNPTYTIVLLSLKLGEHLNKII